MGGADLLRYPSTSFSNRSSRTTGGRRFLKATATGAIFVWHVMVACYPCLRPRLLCAVWRHFVASIELRRVVLEVVISLNCIPPYKLIVKTDPIVEVL